MTPNDAVVAYLNAHFRPDVAANLLAAAQPLMAIAWDEGMAAMYATTDSEWPPIPEANPYRSRKVTPAEMAAKAQAWDEGWQACVNFSTYPEVDGKAPTDTNPYRPTP